MQILESMPDFGKLTSKPSRLFFKGNTSLLSKSPKIAIVGTRRPNIYSKLITQELASKISTYGGVVVSGGALGVDIIAHSSAMPNTIMISPSGLDIIYPITNKKTIEKIYTDALAISEYEDGYAPKNYSFIQRNRLVVAMSDIVIIPQADLNSGSLQSAKIAKKLEKPIFVLPHQLNQSAGTNSLLEAEKAKAIFNVDRFLSDIFGKSLELGGDEILNFCKNMPSFEEAYLKYGEKILEYELEGKLERKNGLLVVL